jgi:hypothetical protein
MEDDDQEVGGPSGAEEAFGALREEVANLKRVVEALPGGWRANRPPDTTPTLIEMTQALKKLGEHLQTIEQHPALRMTPQQHTQAIANAGQGLMHPSVRALDQAAADSRQARQDLAGVIGTARRQDQQLKWLVWTGAIALAFGLLSSPVFARLLPFGLDGQVAAFIMRGDRWHAGEALMQVDSPTDWAQFAAAVDLSKANKAALEACREAAAKAKKEQRCPIVVPAT